MHENNRLQWLDWSLMLKRDSELVGMKKETSFRTDSNGILRVSLQDQQLYADLSTQILIQFALMRRGLGMDQSHLLSFDVHQVWVSHLLAQAMKPPPAGYAQVGTTQLLQADKALFQKMSELCRTGIAPTLLGGRPLDLALPAAMNDASVSFLLMPLPANKRAADSTADGPAKRLQTGAAGQSYQPTYNAPPRPGGA